MTFSIVNISEDGRRQELAVLEDDVVYIGREPPRGGITVDSRAVSREHAVFLRISSQWYYKDLGSSNGSWLNGAHVSAGVPYLLRANDTIQLSDIIIEFSANADSNVEDDYPTLVVFSRGDFINEVAVPDIGKVLSVGGPKSDLKLDVDFEELPKLVVEKRSSFLCAYPVANSHNVLLNGQQLSQLVQLKDRDMLSVSPYTIVINIPSAGLLDSMGTSNLKKSEELKETFTGWEEEHKPVRPTVFGQLRDSAEAVSARSFAIGSDDRQGGRGSGAKEPRDIASIIEERVVFVLGFILVLIILSLVLWWFFN